MPEPAPAPPPGLSMQPRASRAALESDPRYAGGQAGGGHERRHGGRAPTGRTYQEGPGRAPAHAAHQPVLTGDEPRAEGVVAKIDSKDVYGFISKDDAGPRGGRDQIFFHLSQVLPGDGDAGGAPHFHAVSEALAVGDRVSFVVATGSGRDARSMAASVRKLPPRAPPADDELAEEAFEGIVERGLMGAAGQGSNAVANGYGGRIRYEEFGERRLVSFAGADLAPGLKAAPRAGDRVTFRFTAGTGDERRPARIAPAPAPEQAAEQPDAPRETGVVAQCIDAKQYGWIRCADRKEERMFFHYSQVGEGPGERRDDPRAPRQMVSPGDEVEFSVFTDPRVGKLSARGVKTLPKGTVVFELALRPADAGAGAGEGAGEGGGGADAKAAVRFTGCVLAAASESRTRRVDDGWVVCQSDVRTTRAVAVDPAAPALPEGGGEEAARDDDPLVVKRLRVPFGLYELRSVQGPPPRRNDVVSFAVYQNKRTGRVRASDVAIEERAPVAEGEAEQDARKKRQGAAGNDDDDDETSLEGEPRESAEEAERLGRELGQVASLKQQFGFLRCLSRPSDTFFHFSEVPRALVPKLREGVDVSFVLVEDKARGKRIIAKEVRLAEKGAGSSTKVGDEVFTGLCVERLVMTRRGALGRVRLGLEPVERKRRQAAPGGEKEEAGGGGGDAGGADKPGDAKAEPADGAAAEPVAVAAGAAAGAADAADAAPGKEADKAGAAAKADDADAAATPSETEDSPASASVEYTFGPNDLAEQQANPRENDVVTFRIAKDVRTGASRAAAVVPLQMEGRVAGSVRGSKGVVEVESCPGDPLYPTGDRAGAEADRWRKPGSAAGAEPGADEGEGGAEASAPAPAPAAAAAAAPGRKKWVRLSFHASDVVGGAVLRSQDEVFFIPVRNSKPLAALRPSESAFLARRVRLKNPRDPREEEARELPEEVGDGPDPARKPKFGGQLSFRQAKQPDGTRGFAAGRGRPLAAPPPGLAPVRTSVDGDGGGGDGGGGVPHSASAGSLASDASSPGMKSVGSNSRLSADAAVFVPSFSPSPSPSPSRVVNPNAPEFSPKAAAEQQ